MYVREFTYDTFINHEHDGLHETHFVPKSKNTRIQNMPEHMLETQIGRE